MKSSEDFFLLRRPVSAMVITLFFRAFSQVFGGLFVDFLENIFLASFLLSFLTSFFVDFCVAFFDEFCIEVSVYSSSLSSFE